MDLPRIWKPLVCIAASISMVLCTVSMQVAASPAGDGRGPITVVDQGPPIPTDPDAEPDAPYSPGEMMELGITDVTALEPMVLATYPSYTSITTAVFCKPAGNSCPLPTRPARRFTGSTWVRMETCGQDGSTLSPTMAISI